ncbi:hypothetical protein ACHAXR_000479 [Thalassiosira sp. AJA248-18]
MKEEVSLRLIIFLVFISLGFCVIFQALVRPVTKGRGAVSPDQGSADDTILLAHSSPIRIAPDHCNSPLRDHFVKIYEKGSWGSPLRHARDFYSDAAWPPRGIIQKSASGRGSNFGPATENSLKIIKDAISRYNIKSMIDVPCGDVNWIFDSFETDTLPLYIGLDITTNVIEVNKQRFGHHSNKRFFFWDATLTLPAAKVL